MPTTRTPTARARRLRALLGAITAALLLALVPGAASAQTTTPASPPLTTDPAALAAAVSCTGTPRAGQNPILLIPGTTLTPRENFSWNYERAFQQRGRYYCTVALPNHAMSDVQTSAEYVVAAIRQVSGTTGQKVDLVGFSQGGMIGRWGLHFFPDTRAKVRSVIGLDPSNHGTLDAYPACAVGGCAPAFWQQQTFSRFTTALNRGGETVAGINYTSIYTPTDEVVTPNLDPAASSSLTTGPGGKANISTLQICPAHVADHLSMGSSDAVGYALVVDALDHGGLASAARIPRTVCLRPFHEGVDPATFPARFAAYVAGAGFQAATYPHVPAEPPLRPYATTG